MREYRRLRFGAPAIDELSNVRSNRAAGCRGGDALLLGPLLTVVFNDNA